MILLLETATQTCSVALADGGKVLGELHSDEPNAHSARLSTLVEQLLQRESVAFASLDAVCVSSGPGSYTGLRIGVSSAKGYCYALNKPLLAVPTLFSMAETVYAQLPDYHGMVCPMIDARRMECYSAIFQRVSDVTEEVRPVQADIVEQGFYDEWLDRSQVLFIGDGAAKTRDILSVHPNALYESDFETRQGEPYLFQISASGMAVEAMRRLAEGRVEDVAYFEPFYLKDFVAKKSVVRGLR